MEANDCAICSRERLISSPDVVSSNVGVLAWLSFTLSIVTMDSGRLRGLSEESGLRAQDKGEVREGIALDGESLICDVRLKSGTELEFVNVSMAVSAILPRRDDSGLI